MSKKEKTEKKEKKKTSKLTIIIAVILVLAVIGGISRMNGKKDDDNSRSVTENTSSNPAETKETKTKEPETTKTVETTATTSEERTSEDTTAEVRETEDISSTEIRPSVKEKIDSYERFYDEYIDFLRTYDAIRDLEKYMQLMDDLDDWEDDIYELEEAGLTIAEEEYLDDVNTRIVVKLMTIGSKETEAATTPDEGERANQVETSEQVDNSGDTQSGLLPTDIRPEIKEKIDAYESFYDDYLIVMVSGDAMKIADFVLKLSDWEKIVKELPNEGFTEAEKKYYDEAMYRISLKLLAASEA